MKRKWANRVDWKRIRKSRYESIYLSNREFEGYVTCFIIEEIREPLCVKVNNNWVCVADAGYCWLQHFPEGSHYSMTTMFDSQGQVVQWYIDICKQLGVGDEVGGEGVPWLDDLYLDIVIGPTGVVELIDEDELEEALLQGEITQEEYKLAWREARRLLELITEGRFPLPEWSRKHRLLFLPDEPFSGQQETEAAR